jgi:hypothetical protein
MNSNPAFSRIAGRIRESQMPGDTKNKLLLLFYRLSPAEQNSVLGSIEKNPEALPLYAEFITELEQGGIDLSDQRSIEAVLEKYIERIAR